MRLTLFMLALHLIAFGQPEDNTLTVTVSRTTALQPDQVVLSVYADFETTVSTEDVLTAVHSVGITLADLSGIGSTAVNDPQNPGATEWLFVLPTPFAKLSEKLAALADLQQAFLKTSGRSLRYSVQGPQVSPQLQATSACTYGPLLQDASTEARTLAAAAGVMLGPILAISDGTDVYLASGTPAPSAAYRIVDFVGLDPSIPISFSGVPAIRPVLGLFQAPPLSACVLSVQFRILH